MKNIKKFFPHAMMMIAGIIIGWMLFRGGEESTEHTDRVQDTVRVGATVWTCSMHPQVRKDKPGKCPICAMDLVPLNDGEEENTGFNKIQMSESAMKIADIQTTLVQKSSPGKEIRLTGKVKPDETKISVIASRFSGRIEKLFINFTGQKVAQGEKLASIYSPDLITAQKELFEAIKYKQSNPEYYTAARMKLKLWSLSENQIDYIEKSGEPQNYFDVLSPLSGTVMKRQVALGDYVTDGAVLFEIADLSSVWVLFDAYESDLPWIKTGDKVSFEVQSIPGKKFTSTVHFIHPVIDPETRVTYIHTEMDNPDEILKPEMFARGILIASLPLVKDAVVIPKSSVLWTGKRAIVYVKDRSAGKPTFEYREVELGEDAGNFYVVKEGLQEGEEIVTNGVFKVDAAAQLAGKKSMMNTEERNSSAEHQHEGMNMKDSVKKEVGAAFNGDETGIFSFKVYGNCDLCKARIEKAAKSVDGVISVDWNKDTKMISIVTANSDIQAKVISKAIADAGHDTDFNTASDIAYSKLPGCCRFERKKVHHQ